MKFKKRFLALLLAVIVAGTTACGSGGAGKSSTDGQYINTYIGADPTTLDAQKGSDVYGNAIINNIYEPLVRIAEKNGKLEIEPAGAESYEISKDHLTYTFKLRDFKWDDGQPVKAQDYEYGVKRSANPTTGAESAFLLAPIKNFEKVNSGKVKVDELGVKAIDDKTLEIKLEKPTEYFLRLAPLRVMFPQRQDLVDKSKESFGSEANTVLGCGPFKIENWTHNAEIKLIKSDSYWDKNTVKLETINYKILTDPNTIMNSFDVNELDVVSTTLKEWTTKFDKKDHVEKEEIILPSVDYITFNTKDPLLKNTKIRQAIQIALNREGLNKQVYQGVINPATSWVPPSITINGTPFVQEGKGPIDELSKKNKDPKALFIEGLKELKMNPDPSKIKIEYQMVNSPILKSSSEYIQSNLQEKLGINLTLNMMEWPILNTNISKGNYQMGYLSWTADYDDPYAMLSLFAKDATAVNTGWTSEKYDTLIKNASTEKDTKKAMQMYNEAQNILINESPVVPILNVKTNQYRYKYVKNLPISSFSTTGWKYVYTEGR